VGEICKSQLAYIHIFSRESPRVNLCGAYLRHSHPIAYKEEDILSLLGVRLKAQKEESCGTQKETSQHKTPHKMVASTLRPVCKLQNMGIVKFLWRTRVLLGSVSFFIDKLFLKVFNILIQWRYHG
jgi:hypothetical protein